VRTALRILAFLAAYLVGLLADAIFFAFCATRTPFSFWPAWRHFCFDIVLWLDSRYVALTDLVWQEPRA
jgi:hypothetical protein